MATEPRAYRARSGFGDNAPSKTLPFPERANLTAAELLAFFPNSITRADVIYRIISNGGTRKSIHAIINTHRNLEVEWSANCCGAAMYKTMQKAGYSMWTIKKHELWHASRKASWDSNAVDVGGLWIAPGVPAQSVSFRSLAADVRTMPEGDDALDLTRMVQYCVQNSEDGWVYPKDYEELLDLLGGPAEVREENTDGAVFRRWENVKPPPPLPRPTQPAQGIDLLDGWEKSGRRSTMRRETTSSGTRSRTASPVPISLGEGGARRSSARTVLKDAANEEASDALDEADEEQSTPYIREPAEYIPPPPSTAGWPTDSSLLQALQAEGAVGESDPFGAYAFGGPRRTPPYRYLCQVAQPHPWDISGWAENLRWAFEQRTLFAHSFPEAMEWIESPEHIVCIERERTQRVWASDELLEQMLEED